MVMDHDQDRRMSRISIPWQEFDCQLKSIKADAKLNLPWLLLIIQVCLTPVPLHISSILKGSLKGIGVISFESKEEAHAALLNILENVLYLSLHNIPT